MNYFNDSHQMKKETFKLRSVSKKGSGIQVLNIQGDLSIKNAEKLKKKLDNMRFSGTALTINLSNVEILDITCIQILKSLAEDLLIQGRKINILTDLSEDLQRLLSNAGFKEFTNHSAK